MTTNNRAKPAALGGTMEAPEAATPHAAAARAQAELIELLARRLLAAIEAGSVATDTTRQADAHERRTRRPRI